MSNNKYDYNKHTGLPVMANLTVINQIYFKMKKADQFYDDGEGTKRNKKKAIPLWGISSGMIPISRQRFNRIKKGMNFSISNNEATQIAQLFGIDKQYFWTEKPVLFEIDNISEYDWKAYFHDKYRVKYDIDTTETEGIKGSASLVGEKLKELPKSISKGNPDMGNPVDKIKYYFETGIKYGEEIQIDKCINILKKIDFSYWDKEAETEDGWNKLAECHKLIKNHYNYINSLMMIRKLKK